MCGRVDCTNRLVYYNFTTGIQLVINLNSCLNFDHTISGAFPFVSLSSLVGAYYLHHRVYVLYYYKNYLHVLARGESHN